MRDLRHISSLFDMRADFVHAHPYGSGHINDTYCASHNLDRCRNQFAFVSKLEMRMTELVGVVDRVQQGI